MDLPKRKALRLPEFDYSSSGAYFVTICTQDRRCILSRIAVGARSLLSKAIGYMKMNSSKRIHQKHPDMDIFQRSYHEHVIRVEADYREIWSYIDSNPAKWAEDRYYMA